MSFISKLFRKAEPEEEPEAATAQPVKPDAGERADEPAQAAEEARDQAQEDEHGEQPGGAAPEAAPAPIEAEEGAWWEDSWPLAARDQRAAAEQNDTSEASAAPDEPAERQQPEDGIGPSALPVAQVEETGTRPLTASDVPALAPQRSLRGLAAAALRDVGRVRQINQDSVFALLTTVPRESGDISIGLFIVADGMGGHQGGEVASRMAISAVARHVLTELLIPALIDGSAEAIQPLIIAAVQDANRAIWEHAQAIGSDMGTTCTVVLLLGRALYIGHVGDSRAYLATPAELKQITSDHSTVGRLIQLGQLDPAEVREHPLRSQLYRTIGQQREVLVDFTYQQLGDATHLLVCSDGLWGMIGDEAMLDVVQQHTWPQDACNELIARANLAGGEDNISAIVVSLPSSSQ